MKIIKYWIPTLGYTRDSSYSFQTKLTDHDLIAEAAANEYFSNHDGWENKWPLDFNVEIDNKVYEFEIELETMPSFSARLRNEIPQKAD